MNEAMLDAMKEQIFQLLRKSLPLAAKVYDEHKEPDTREFLILSLAAFVEEELFKLFHDFAWKIIAAEEEHRAKKPTLPA